MGFIPLDEGFPHPKRAEQSAADAEDCQCPVVRRSVSRPNIGAGFAPTPVTTDQLRSYGAAFRKLGLTAHHKQGRRQNNRAEVSHPPLRRRERKRQRFQSPGSTQRFGSMHSATSNTFNLQRHLLCRRTLRSFREQAMATWQAASAAA